MTEKVEMESIAYLKRVPISKSKGGRDCVYRDFERAGAPKIEQLNFFPGKNIEQKVFNWLDVNGFQVASVTQLAVAVTQGCKVNKITSIAARNGLAVQAIRGVISFLIKYEKELTHLLAVYFPDAAIPEVSKMFDDMPYAERQKILKENMEARLELANPGEDSRPIDWEALGEPEPKYYPPVAPRVRMTPVRTPENAWAFWSKEGEPPVIGGNSIVDYMSLCGEGGDGGYMDNVVAVSMIHLRNYDGDVVEVDLTNHPNAKASERNPVGNSYIDLQDMRFTVPIKGYPGWTVKYTFNAIFTINAPTGSVHSALTNPEVLEFFGPQGNPVTSAQEIEDLNKIILPQRYTDPGYILNAEVVRPTAQ